MSGGIAVASIAVAASYSSALFQKIEEALAYRYNDVGLDVILGTLPGEGSRQTDQSHFLISGATLSGERKETHSWRLSSWLVRCFRIHQQRKLY